MAPLWRGDPLSWLLEADNSGVRHLALRDLVGLPADAPELLAARREAHAGGPIAATLAQMAPEGFWVQPGAGYGPKYRSTVWSVISLAQLGGSVAEDERVATACRYLLDHTLTQAGQFSTSASASGTVDCLQGNLCAAVLDLGYDDPHLAAAFDWMARTVTGEGIAPMAEKDAPVRYYAGKCGPLFLCGANNKMACAWGAIKVMLAFAKWPAERRTPRIERAMAAGIDFLFSTDPAKADYPSGYSDKPSGSWFKFGFPVFYVTDVLQNLEALVALGYGDDPRLSNAIDFVLSKQDAQGRWPLEYDYAGKTWVDYGAKKQPSKWVTLRALRVLKGVSGN
jgi:hypothetical protein